MHCSDWPVIIIIKLVLNITRATVSLFNVLSIKWKGLETPLLWSVYRSETDQRLFAMSRSPDLSTGSIRTYGSPVSFLKECADA